MHFERIDAPTTAPGRGPGSPAPVPGMDAYRRGDALAAEKRWEEAAAEFERAVTLAPARPIWWRRLGLARTHLEDIDGALAAHRRSVDLHDDPPVRWLADLGKAATRAEDRETARQVFAEMLRKDPATRPNDHVLLERNPRFFLPRRRTSRFIAENIDGIRAAASRHTPVEDRSETVWTYWAQGFESAPPVVQMAHRSLVRHMGDAVRPLTNDDAWNLAQLPPDIDAMLPNLTVRADMLRLELLVRYGGLWMDATCYVRHDVRPELSDLARPSGFFAFAKDRESIGTWLLSASPGHYIAAMLLEANYAHWRQFNRNLSYLSFHHIFEALADSDERFEEYWRATPRVHYGRALRFRHHLVDPFDADAYERFLNGALVHKLSYKYDAEGTQNTMISTLLAEEEEAAEGRT